MRNLILALLLLTSGCANVKTVAYAGYDFQDEIRGGNPIAVFTVDGKYTLDHSYAPDRCGWMHVSHYFAGKPFNGKKEDTMDMLQCSWVLYESE